MPGGTARTDHAGRRHDDADVSVVFLGRDLREKLLVEGDADADAVRTQGGQKAIVVASAVA